MYVYFCARICVRAVVSQQKKLFHQGKFIQHRTDSTTIVLSLCVYVGVGALVHVYVHVWTPVQVEMHTGQCPTYL